jgi:acetyltransferase-like isoleucine patch superfamily enzyme
VSKVSIQLAEGPLDSTAPTLIEGKIFLGKLSRIIDSRFSGFGQIDAFSCVNRSSFGLGFGLGVSSYVADASVGNFTLFGSRVSVGGFEHPIDRLAIGAFQWGQTIEHWDVNETSKAFFLKNSKPEMAKTEIGSDVWIGNNVVVKAGVKIGHGSIIGAGSVVTKDIEDYSIVVGNPARLLRMRFSQDVIRELLNIEWWNFSLELLSRLDFSNVGESINILKKVKKDIEE